MNSTAQQVGAAQYFQPLRDMINGISVFQMILILIAGVVIYDQVNYIIKKGSIAGPRFKMWPIIGPFLESMEPKFEQYEAKWASGPLSCVSVFHKFVVIASTRDLSRKILNSPNYLRPCIVDVATTLLRPTNWVFKDGKAHLDYRRSLNPLFTRQALAIYLPVMEEMYNKYLDEFVDITKDSPEALMSKFRELNCANSLRIFCGHYISSEQVKTICDNYYKVTAALELVNFPIIIPYTRTWYGKKCTDYVMDVFADCAEKSKRHIAAGGAVNSVMDAWIKMMDDSKKGNTDIDADIRKTLVREFSNREIAETVFTFLFASQDATSAATTWMFHVLGNRPDIREKVREEQLAVRGGNPNVPLSLELVDKMKYTNMVIRELLRYRPPVSMIPYVAKRDFPITENYTVPKGAMVIPTLHTPLQDEEVYENPTEFNPDRWTPGSPATKALSNWLVFGSGPHVCLGQVYVMMHMTALTGKACMNYDWKRITTPTSDTIRIFAGIFPADDCIIQIEKRPEVAA